MNDGATSLGYVSNCQDVIVTATWPAVGNNERSTPAREISGYAKVRRVLAEWGETFRDSGLSHVVSLRTQFLSRRRLGRLRTHRTSFPKSYLMTPHFRCSRIRSKLRGHRRSLLGLGSRLRVTSHPQSPMNRPPGARLEWSSSWPERPTYPSLPRFPSCPSCPSCPSSLWCRWPPWFPSPAMKQPTLLTHHLTS